MQSGSLPTQQQRLGFHYFPDVMHYRDSDLVRWLPELQAFGAAWVVLYAQDDHAIPEPFLSGLINANIKPVLHIHSSTSYPARIESIKSLLNAYASWGVRHVTFFDQPNMLSSWSPTAWAQDKLADRFLDLYLPYAEAALSLGMTPITPPLQPGGNYWDTAFLRDLLSAIKRRGYLSILEHMALGAYARIGNRPLNWGSGGPERWPASKPYLTPESSQDQCGFRIFDWYLAITKAVTGKMVPVILFEVGCHNDESTDPRYSPVTMEEHTSNHVEIARALAGQETEVDAIPPEVMACNFWPVCTAPGHPEAAHAWYQSKGGKQTVVEALRNWAQSITPVPQNAASTTSHGNINPHPIAHYLLLTEELWGKQGHSSPILRNFLQKYKPAIGFSPSEAALARRVTIYGSAQMISDIVVDQLISAGCQVERIQEDGTLIASTSSVA
jgi:hypothetical protein